MEYAKYWRIAIKMDIILLYFMIFFKKKNRYFSKKKSAKMGEFSANGGKNFHYSGVNLQENFNGRIFFPLTGVIPLLGISTIGEFYCTSIILFITQILF